MGVGADTLVLSPSYNPHANKLFHPIFFYKKQIDQLKLMYEVYF